MVHSTKEINDFPRAKAIVFDGDGVCYNTEHLFYQAYKNLMQVYGIDFTINDYLVLVGLSAEEGVKYCKSRHNIKEDVDVMCQQWKIFRDNAFSQNEVVAREGVLPFVSALSEDNAMMALVTSSDYESTMIKIAKAGYSHRFKNIVCANNQFRRKPYPDLYLYAAELLKIPANTMFVVEDSETGIDAASKAGCYCVAFPNEYTTHHEFKNAHYIATSIQDLRDHFTFRTLGERQRFC